MNKHQIKFYLEDAICQLLENRDETGKSNPAKFLSDYFYSVHNGDHILFREYNYLQATQYNRKHLIKMIWSCFRNVSTEGSELLSVQEYHSLITLICFDFPLEVVQNTFKIVLMEDASDCFMSFVDFLYALQIQVVYEEFVKYTKEVFDQLQVDDKVGSSSANNSDTSLATYQQEDLDSKVFLEALKMFYSKMKTTFSSPSINLFEKELLKTNKITFYSFLTSLSKNQQINQEIGVLPEREKVFEGKDVSLFSGNSN